VNYFASLSKLNMYFYLPILWLVKETDFLIFLNASFFKPIQTEIGGHQYLHWHRLYTAYYSNLFNFLLLALFSLSPVGCAWSLMATKNIANRCG
jgi:hypothetical protein